MRLIDLVAASFAAEKAYTAEVERVFGADACQARYLPRGKGEPGSELRRLHDARAAARNTESAAWAAQIKAA